ncbi:MAG: hypothetical protein AAGF47_07915 [Planctomycetota bacterium]
MTLEQAIRAWDGNSAAAIRAVYADHANDTAFLTDLLEFTGDPELSRGATWLLKHRLEQLDHRDAFDAQAVAALCRLLDRLEDWGASLHVLQCLPYEAVTSRDGDRVARFLDRCLTNRRSMVRAWAYWGYSRLAIRHARYRAEACDLLADAQESENAGSVRIRVRRAIEALEGVG